MLKKNTVLFYDFKYINNDNHIDTVCEKNVQYAFFKEEFFGVSRSSQKHFLEFRRSLPYLPQSTASMANDPIVEGMIVVVSDAFLVEACLLEEM